MLCNLVLKRNLVSLIVMMVCLLLIPIYNFALFNIYSTSGVDSCPFCFDESYCSCFINGSFFLDWNNFWINLFNVGFNNLQGEKIVVFGRCNEEQVVLKIFSSNIDQNKFYLTASNATITFREILENMKHFLRPKFGYALHKLYFCPNADRLEVFLTPLSKDSGDLTHFYLGLQYMMEVNTEPIIQQVTRDWAVAPYLGSCGMITVSKYCGETLTWISPKLNWSERALVTNQLLQFAFNATFDNPDFAFYFTDMSADNFAVSSEKEVKLVDLEHVIVVDKLAKDMPHDWSDSHQIYHDDTVNQFAFSVEEICSHEISDLNIYSICQGILSEKADLITGGLLHSPPQGMDHVRGLIEECISPKTGASRFEVAHSIIKTLNAR